MYAIVDNSGVFLSDTEDFRKDMIGWLFWSQSSVDIINSLNPSFILIEKSSKIGGDEEIKRPMSKEEFNKLWVLMKRVKQDK